MAAEERVADRVGELIGLTVIDREGRDLGKVHDIRLRRDGPILPDFGAALRVEALVIGRESVATRLGFARLQMTGPWPIDVWGQWALRRTHLVPWESIQRAGDALQCHLGVDELEPAGR
jgi:sporulation protein YlmC with PRC-barrel domain